MRNLFLRVGSWFLVLCLLVGLGYLCFYLAFFLYFNGRGNWDGLSAFSCSGLPGYNATKSYSDETILTCMLEKADPYQLADYQSGATILALIPTIVGLFALPSLDIIALAIRSPHMALAACVYGVNIPGGILKELRNFDHEGDPLKGNVRQWRVKLHAKGCSVPSYLLEFACLIIPASYFWKLVSQAFYVSFRPQNYLVMFWPIAGVAWLLISMILLLCMAKIEIAEDTPGGKKHNWFHFFLLKYRGPPPHVRQHFKQLKEGSSQSPRPPAPATLIKKRRPQNTGSSISIPTAATDAATLEPVASAAPSEQHVPSSEPQSEKLTPPYSTIPSHYVLTLTMRVRDGWAYYQTFVDVCAMGVYLYGTVIFASVIFVPSWEAMFVLFPLAGAQIPIHFMARRWAPRLVQQQQTSHQSSHEHSPESSLNQHSRPSTPQPEYNSPPNSSLHHNDPSLSQSAPLLPGAPAPT